MTITPEMWVGIIAGVQGVTLSALLVAWAFRRLG